MHVAAVDDAAQVHSYTRTMAHVAVFFVRLTGLIFLIFGVACVIAPAQMPEAATGATMQHPVGLIDLRATYGGMSLGVAVILFGKNGDVPHLMHA